MKHSPNFSRRMFQNISIFFYDLLYVNYITFFDVIESFIHTKKFSDVFIGRNIDNSRCTSSTMLRCGCRIEEKINVIFSSFNFLNHNLAVNCVPWSQIILAGLRLVGMYSWNNFLMTVTVLAFLIGYITTNLLNTSMVVKRYLTPVVEVGRGP